MKNKTLRRGALGVILLAAAGIYAAVTGTRPEHLAFYGNTTTFGVSKADLTFLQRQPDCSVTATTFYPAHIPFTTANFQLTLHQLSGLKTTPNLFPHGCKDPTLGIPSTDSSYIGKTSTGLYEEVEAALFGDNLVVNAVNATALTLQTTTLATNVSSQVSAVDVNKDGFPDIVAAGVTDPATHQQGLAVYLNKGDGTFQAGVVYALTIPGGSSFVIDDVTGDGNPDIVVQTLAGDGSGALTTLVGRGDGTFTVGPSVAGQTTFKIVTGDFNGDGKMDVLSSLGLLYLGHGDGSFATGVQAATLGVITTALAVGDFDGDGKLDFADAEGAIVIHHGNGDGTFTRGATYASLYSPVAMVAVDMDGDGNVDLMVARSGNGDYGPGASSWNWQALMGAGDGTFVAPNVTLANSALLIGQHPAATVYAAADFDSDGVIDLVFPAPPPNNFTLPTGLAFARGRGNGTFATAVVSPTNFSPSVTAAADFNGDGKLDVVAVGTSTTTFAGMLGVFTGSGDGTLSGEADYALPPNAGVPTTVLTGDFNGDGLPDVAVALIGGGFCSGCASGVYVLYGKPDHTLTAAVAVDTSALPLVAAGDLNADGRTDLVVVDPGVFGATPTPGGITLYTGNANNTFTASTLTTPPLYWSDIRVADLNQDGKLDLVAGAITSVGGDTEIVYLAGQGNGTFGMATQTVIPGGRADPAPTLAVADFDGDGHPDVAFFLPGAFSGVFFGTGTGTFSKHLSFGLSPGQPGDPLAVDLTGDARADLLFADAYAGGVVSYINQTAALTSGGAVSSTSLAAAPSPVSAGQTVTLTATVTGTAATGSVAFLDGTTLLGSAALSADGTATVTSAALVAGTHALTAQYSGDTTFAGSTSAAVSVTVNATADFALATSPASGTIAAGQAASTTLTLSPTGGFTGDVGLSCSGLPAGATCTFAPASVTLGAAAATSMLTIDTAARMAGVIAPSNPADPLLPLGTVLAGVVVPAITYRRGRRGSHLGRASRWLVVFAMLGGLLHACGGNHAASPITAPVGGTPAGTYAITVTATSGASSHTVAYSLTVN
jgi:Bacterial Ig-like domain (group 3)/FG-GAP-like repeat